MAPLAPGLLLSRLQHPSAKAHPLQVFVHSQPIQEPHADALDALAANRLDADIDDAHEARGIFSHKDDVIIEIQSARVVSADVLCCDADVRVQVQPEHPQPPEGTMLHGRVVLQRVDRRVVRGHIVSHNDPRRHISARCQADQHWHCSGSRISLSLRARPKLSPAKRIEA